MSIPLFMLVRLSRHHHWFEHLAGLRRANYITLRPAQPGRTLNSEPQLSPKEFIVTDVCRMVSDGPVAKRRRCVPRDVVVVFSPYSLLDNQNQLSVQLGRMHEIAQLTFA